jgi:hypothetical protein
MLRGNRTMQLSFFLFYYSGGEGTEIRCLAKKSLEDVVNNPGMGLLPVAYAAGIGGNK